MGLNARIVWISSDPVMFPVACYTEMGNFQILFISFFLKGCNVTFLKVYFYVYLHTEMVLNN